jgi:hypothetical protein
MLGRASLGSNVQWSEVVLGKFTNDATINLDTLKSDTGYSIVIETTITNFTSVDFIYDGTAIKQVERGAPYVAAGNNGNLYYNVPYISNLPLGPRSIVVNAWFSTTLASSFTYRFTIVRSTVIPKSTSKPVTPVSTPFQAPTSIPLSVPVPTAAPKSNPVAAPIAPIGAVPVPVALPTDPLDGLNFLTGAFALVRASLGSNVQWSEVVMGKFTNDATINLDILKSDTGYSIVIETTVTNFTTVDFIYDGTSIKQVERGAPYAASGNNGNLYYDVPYISNLPLGPRSITVNAWFNTTLASSCTYRFTIVRSTVIPKPTSMPFTPVTVPFSVPVPILVPVATAPARVPIPGAAPITSAPTPIIFSGPPPIEQLSEGISQYWELTTINKSTRP